LRGGVDQANRTVNLRNTVRLLAAGLSDFRNITSISSTLVTIPLINALAFSTNASPSRV
jgi:hypothetical protein